MDKRISHSTNRQESVKILSKRWRGGRTAEGELYESSSTSTSKTLGSMHAPYSSMEERPHEEAGTVPDGGMWPALDARTSRPCVGRYGTYTGHDITDTSAQACWYLAYNEVASWHPP